MRGGSAWYFPSQSVAEQRMLDARAIMSKARGFGRAGKRKRRDGLGLECSSKGAPFCHGTIS
jgi:hypothetical protein